MEAAASMGIAIPSMCFHAGYSNHPSCMVCLVKDCDRDQLVPSCAMTVHEGMHILTGSDEVTEARREALELLLSDHAGDCEAPCRLSCPAFMDIPLMNRLIASGDFEQALKIIRSEIALPLILGYICPAPCEKACKRRQIDKPVSICLLKRSAAQYHERQNNGLPPVPKTNGKTVAIIGTGPAGLSAAFYLLRSGHACTLFDQHEKAGGSLQYNIPEDVLPREIIDTETRIIRQMGAQFSLGLNVTREIFQNNIEGKFDAVVLASGTMTPGHAGIFGIQPDEHGQFVDKKTLRTSLPGIFACGNIIREQKMAVHSVAQGKLAAHQVALFLGTPETAPFRPGFNSVIGPLFETEWQEYLRESIPDQRVEPAGGLIAGFSRDEAIHEARRCMHCDCRKPATCKLRLYADEYDANRKRFAGQQRKLITRSVQHDLVVYEQEKCIRCGLCVDITRAHGESVGMTFVARGFDVHISVPFSGTVKEAITTTAGECVAACPTGALSWKDREERNSS
jgi:NADPH-dependent glutamate synthase beta subunit-like oxidoreductase/ferredoxin